MRTVAIVQARMGSTRLPGKVLMDVAGEPMLVRVLGRLGRSARLDEVILATSDLPRDDRVADVAAATGAVVFRGSEEDVLGRYLAAARRHEADVVVRVTADCPLVDPEVVDRVVDALGANDYACNHLPRATWPLGLTTQVFTRAALERADALDRDPASREHVVSYIDAHPEAFRTVGVASDRDDSDLRWTVDTRADLEEACRIFEHFGHDRFGWRDALAFARKDLAARRPA